MLIQDNEEELRGILDDIIDNIEAATVVVVEGDEENVEILRSKVKSLEKKNSLLVNENCSLNRLFQEYKREREEKFENEVGSLREKLAEKERELSGLEGKFNESELHKRQVIDQLNVDFKNRLEQTFKKFQEIQKDKTSMIMKYAEAEKKAIELSRSNEHLQSRMTDFLKEKQRLIEKLEVKNQEKARFNADLEAKLNEISSLNKQIEKLKEVNVLNEVKMNKLESKYKNECEINIENKKLIEVLNSQLIKLKNLTQQAMSSSTAAGDSEESELNNAVNEVVEAIELVTNTNPASSSDHEKYLKLSSKMKALSEELTQAKAKMTTSENENKASMITIQNYKETLNSQKQMNKELLSEILQLRELQVTLTKEQQEKKLLEAKVEALTSELNDSNQEMASFKLKQNESLSFTSKLTEKNSKLQSENLTLNERLQSLTSEFENIKNRLSKSDESNKLMVSSLNDRLNAKLKENETLATQLSEKTKLADELGVKLNDVQDEITSMKKKHMANLKDLTNQLQKLHKQADVPVRKQQAVIPSNAVSRSNSITSLDKEDMKSLGSISSGDSTSNNNNATLVDQNASTTSSIVNNSHQPDVYVVDIDKQKIIEKVVKLQKTLAKKTEKIDFLQDHVNQLTADLQRKTKIIQAYAMKEEVGAFTSEAHDANKREMSRKTGVMASIYGTSNPHYNALAALNGSANMTMELSLEINSKLQALLEDTLMKNITLKESFETLGQEIARLSQENRQIKMLHS